MQTAMFYKYDVNYGILLSVPNVTWVKNFTAAVTLNPPIKVRHQSDQITIIKNSVCVVGIDCISPALTLYNSECNIEVTFPNEVIFQPSSFTI